MSVSLIGKLRWLHAWRNGQIEDSIMAAKVYVVNEKEKWEKLIK